MVLRTLAVAIGITTSIFASTSPPPEWTPYLIAVLALVAEGLSLRSESIRGTAQSLRRNADIQDSFGWSMPRQDLTDAFLRSPRMIQKRAAKLVTTAPQPYFRSKKEPGVPRALDNIEESSWWSMHLSDKMRTVCIVILLIPVVFAIATLSAAMNLLTPATAEVARDVARFVNALVSLLLSLGMIKLALGYHKFNKKCEQVRDRVRALKSDPSATANDLGAFKLFYEYHIARALAPAMPHVIWYLNENQLNQQFHFCDEPPPAAPDPLKATSP